MARPRDHIENQTYEKCQFRAVEGAPDRCRLGDRYLARSGGGCSLQQAVPIIPCDRPGCGSRTDPMRNERQVGRVGVDARAVGSTWPVAHLEGLESLQPRPITGPAIVGTPFVPQERGSALEDSWSKAGPLPLIRRKWPRGSQCNGPDATT